MKTLKIILIVLVLSMAYLNFCLGQTGKYRDKLRPNVQAKLDSLYPHATSYIVLNDKYVSDTTQETSINCHCPETTDMIKLVFDTNANILYKEVHYYGSLAGLPDTISRYIEKNTGPKIKFSTEFDRCINKKGEISYNIYMQESFTPYILKFKPSGKLISKEILQGGEQ
jgi:hypothetical protein